MSQVLTPLAIKLQQQLIDEKTLSKTLRVFFFKNPMNPKCPDMHRQQLELHCRKAEQALLRLLRKKNPTMHDGFKTKVRDFRPKKPLNLFYKYLWTSLEYPGPHTLKKIIQLHKFINVKYQCLASYIRNVNHVVN